MPDGQNNTPARQRARAAVKRLASEASKVTTFCLPVRDTTPDVQSAINCWIDWTTGQLKFRSPDGTVQTLGTGGHGGTGAIGGAIAYSTGELLLSPAETKVFPARGDNHLAYGPGVCSVMRFVMPALSPVGAEILSVELYLSSLDASGTDATVNELYFGGDAVGGAIPGSYPVIPAPLTQGSLPRTGAGWVPLHRTFGANLRDGVWNAVVITPHKLTPALTGLVAGLADSAAPPVLRIQYAKET
jgi:hypothetical protein